MCGAPTVLRVCCICKQGLDIHGRADDKVGERTSVSTLPGAIANETRAGSSLAKVLPAVHQNLHDRVGKSKYLARLFMAALAAL